MSAPIADETRLKAEQQRAARTSGLLQGEANALRTQIAQSERDVKLLMQAEARTGEEGAAAEARSKHEELRRQLSLTEERAEAAAVAARQAGEELRALRLAHLDTFLSERLVPLGERAEEALAAVEEPLRAARLAYDELVAAWAPFYPALREHVTEVSAARGRHEPAARVDALSRLPEFPALDELALFESIRRGGFAFRPAALKITEPAPVEIFDAEVEVS